MLIQVIPYAGGSLDLLLCHGRETAEAVRRCYVLIDKAFLRTQEREMLESVLGISRGSWPLIAQERDFPRDATPRLVERLRSAAGRSTFLLIRGGPAEGKTTLLRRLGASMVREGWVVLELRPAARLGQDWMSLAVELAARSKSPTMLLLDDAFEIPCFPTLLNEPCPNLHIAATTRTSRDQSHMLPRSAGIDWLMAGEAESGQTRWPELSGLSEEEAGAAKEKLPELARIDPAVWSRLLRQARSGSLPLLALLLQASGSGDVFDSIVCRTIEDVRRASPETYDVIGAIATFHVLGIPTPDVALAWITGKPSYPQRLRQELRRGRGRLGVVGLVVPADPSTGPSQWMISHATIAEALLRLEYSDLADQYATDVFSHSDTSPEASEFLSRLLRVLLHEHRPLAQTLLGRSHERIRAMAESARGNACYWAQTASDLGEHVLARDLLTVCIPQTGTQAIVVAKLLESLADLRRAIEWGLAWATQHEHDAALRNLLVSLADRQEDAAQVTMVIDETTLWLRSHADDISVRAPHLGLVERRGTGTQIVALIEETAAWLAGHPEDTHVRAAYMGLIEQRGTETQIAALIEGTATWLTSHPEDAHVRAANMRLVERCGTHCQVSALIEGTATWLTRHPEDSHVRATNMGLVERRGSKTQIATLIADTTEWLKGHAEDSAMRISYLGLVERRGSKTQIATLIADTAEWLRSHAEDSTVRVSYLGLVGRCWSLAQSATPIQDTAVWLGNHPDDNYVRSPYLALVAQHGTDTEVAMAIEETGAWLTSHLEDAHVRATNMGLVERRGSKTQIATLIADTTEWLKGPAANSNVRASHLALVDRHGTDTQIATLIAETAEWLKGHDEDSNVRASYLGLVERHATDTQIATLIAETMEWLEGHAEDSNVRASYLGLVGRCGTDAQIVMVITEAAEWLKSHAGDSNVRASYLGLVERCGTDAEAESLCRSIAALTGLTSEPDLSLGAALSLVRRRGDPEACLRLAENILASLVETPPPQVLVGLLLLGLRVQGAQTRRKLAELATRYAASSGTLEGLILGIRATLCEDLLAPGVVRGMYLNAVRKSPQSNHQTRLAFGRFLIRQGEYAEACVYLRQVLTERPGHALAHSLLGECYAATGAPERATGEIELAIEHAEYRAPFCNQLGQLYRTLGNVERARKAFVSALEADPDYYWSRKNLGELELEQGHSAAARRSFAEALAVIQERSSDEWRKEQGVVSSLIDQIDAALSA